MSKNKYWILMIIIGLIFTSSLVIGAFSQQTEIVTIELSKTEIEVELNKEFDPKSIIVGGNYDKLNLPIVDTSQIGQHHLIYQAIKGVSFLELQVVMNVVDKDEPVFSKKVNKVTAEFDEKGLDLSKFFEANDAVDGKLKVKINGSYNLKKAGSYKLVAIASDKSNNQVKHAFELVVKPEPKKVVVKKEATKKEEKKKEEKKNDKKLPADTGTGVPVRLTRYGYDCIGCNVNSQGYSHTALGVAFNADSVRQNDGTWLKGYTYHGYYVFAANKKYPFCTTFLLYDHPYSGSGVVQGQPIKGIVLDRGSLPEDLIDLFVGSEHNLNTIKNVGSKRKARMVLTNEARRVGKGCVFK